MKKRSKHKSLNISTASLRNVSSSKRSRRKSSSKNNTTTTSSSNDISKIHKHCLIGKSSNKSFECKGCFSVFRIYSDSSSFMKKHVMSNERCPLAYPKCFSCKKIFFEEKNLISHQSKSPRNSDCYKAYISSKINTNFMSSEVDIPLIKKPRNSTTDIPSHLSLLHNIEKNLMFSKQHQNYSSFLSTKNFQNLNIHSHKTSIPSEFMGHAIMEPNLLNLKKSA